MNVFEEKIHALRVEKATRNRELCEKRNEMFREIDGRKLDKNQNSYKRTVNWMIDQMVEFYKEQV